MKLLLFSALVLFNINAFADHHEHQVPEYFYQPMSGQNVAELGFNYGHSMDDNVNDSYNFRLSYAHGISHNVGLLLGASYTTLEGSGTAGDGLNNFDLDVVAHNKIADSLRLHYGLRGSITPNKTGEQNFTSFHTFSPYLGLSTLGMGNMTFGAEFVYNAIRTSGKVFPAFDYVGSVFAEYHSMDKFLAGLSVGYKGYEADATSDVLALGAYGRWYLCEAMTLLPRFVYSLAMEDGVEDSLGAEIALRYKF